MPIDFAKLVQKKNLPKIAVICAVLLFIFLRIPSFENDFGDRDEPAYAWQSLVIYKNPLDIMLPEVNFPYYALFPAIASPLHFFFEPPVPTRIASLAFGLVALFFTYLIGKRLFSEKAGLVAVVLMLFSPAFFMYSTKGLMDVPLAALSAIVIYLLLTLNRKRAVLLAAALAAMYLIKTPSMVVLPAVAGYLLLRYRKKISKKQVILAIVILALAGLASLAFSPYNLEYAFGKILTLGGYDEFLIKLSGWFVWLLMGPLMALFALAGMMQLDKKQNLDNALLFFWLISYCGIMILAGGFWIRYYLPVVPIFAVLAGYGFARLIERKKLIAGILLAVGIGLFFWGYYWEVVYWGMPGRVLYLKGEPSEQDKWDAISNWFSENLGEEDKAIILAERFIVRGIRLPAEIGLKNARQQMVVNPSREEFEEIVKEKEGEYFVVWDNLSYKRKIWDVSWLHDMDMNGSEYLASQGFEKVAEMPSGFGENYLFYKKVD